MKITTDASGFRVREHRGFGHGLAPGTVSDMNCPSCKREGAVYTSDDIANARDDLRGECTCTFVATEVEGIFTRPETDRHCPVHNWAYQLQRKVRGICPDPAAHKLHTDGRWMYETCPHCGSDEPLKPCTGCEQLSTELVPWSGERLCWTCTDLQLDLLAKALEDEPVQVGGFGLR